MLQLQTIRIFVSSPSDVAEERDGARRVVEGLRKLYPSVDLQTVFWEELALPATVSFQESIDFLLERQPIDIAVFILWSRLGSPLGAVIKRADGSSYRSGTERELDLMLTAFEQSGRKRPVILAYVREDDAGFKKRLAESPKSELAELIEQQQLAEAFIVEQFHDAEGRNLRAYQTYREPIGFREQLKGHLRRALDDMLEVENAATWTEDPYRGLETFGIEHAPIFYGRDEETCDVLQRLRDQRVDGCAFVVIIAASGSGKSSLARAGVAANLVQGDDDDRTEWSVSSIIPTLAPQGLCDALVRSLEDALPDLVESDESRERIAKGLVENASLTVELMIGPAFERADPVRLLLILDQMEELWTDRNTTEDEREAFLNAVAALAESGRVSVLATLRSDFYPYAQRSPTFLRLKGIRGHYDLLPPDAVSIHRLITEPARLAGLGFERNEKTGKSLDEVVWEDASHDADALPLLEYTLSELYRQRDKKGGLMTFAAYVGLGGVEGAIGKRADEAFASLPADGQMALDEILPLLVSVDTAGESFGVRRRASVADLISTPSRKTLTEMLIEQRFLTTDREGEMPVASLAHEALLRSWDRIVSWINTNREQLRLRARVEQQQQRWEQLNQDDSLLLADGVPLDEGNALIDKAHSLLSDSTTDYIRKSITHHQQRTKQAHRLKLIAATILVVLLSVITMGAFVTRRQRQREVTESLVTAITTARGVAFPPTVDDLDDLPKEIVLEELAKRFESAEVNEKLSLAFALARYTDIRVDYLVSRIHEARPEEFDNFVVALRGGMEEALTAMGEAVAALDQSTSAHRSRARFAMLRFYFGDPALAVDMCSQRPDPIQRTVFVDECSSWRGDLTRLRELASEVVDSPLRSALCLIVGSVPPDRVTKDERDAWEGLLTDWHRNQPDNFTHSASGWALRQWGLPIPALPEHEHSREQKKQIANLVARVAELDQQIADARLQRRRKTSEQELLEDQKVSVHPAQDRVEERLLALQSEAESQLHRASREGMPTWRMNDVGMTMLRIHAGSFASYGKTLEVTQDFFLSDREVSATQFRQFIDEVARDPSYPVSDRPDGQRGFYPTGDHPICASWEDAVRFCNWLSRKEGRQICYRRVTIRSKDPGQFDSNQLEAVEQQIAKTPFETVQKQQLQIQKYALLFQLGRYEESLAGLNALHERGVDDASVHRYRAVLFARSGNADEAHESLERFVKRAGERSDSSLRLYLSMIVESWLGNGQSAIEHLREDLNNHRGDRFFLYNAACACSLSSVAAAHHGKGELEVELKSMTVGLLREALEKGQDRDQLGTDPDLDPLRQDADFIKLRPVSSEGDEQWETDVSSNGYRLPTNAEWEYACRAGTTTKFSFGDDVKWLDRYGIYRADSSEACGTKFPNGWGLFDMHGNLYEWCDDAVRSMRVQRGGSWGGNATSCWSSSFSGVRGKVLTNQDGFRVAGSFFDQETDKQISGDLQADPTVSQP